MCLASPALAAKALHTNGLSPDAPRGNWTVGPVKSLSPDGPAYCSMKNSYPGNHMLIFARNTEGANSFAFDFGEKAFVQGGRYPVRLDIGPLSRNMIGIAADTQVLILQMGADIPFYEMLRQKELLHAIVDGKERTYGLDAANEALRVLETCVNALADKKEFTAIEVPVAGVAVRNDNVVSESSEKPLSTQSFESSLLDEIEILRAQNRKLLLENQRMSNRIVDEQLPVIRTLPVEHPRNEGPKVSAAPVTPVEMKPQPLPLPETNDPLPQTIVKAFNKINITVKKSKDKWVARRVSGDVSLYKISNDVQDLLARYFDLLEYDCAGDFAHTSSDRGKKASFTVTEAETACIDGQDGRAKALAVLKKKNDIVIVAFNADAMDMPQALQMRDNFVNAIMQPEADR